MSATPIRTERRGNVLEVTLDRPKANAIDSRPAGSWATCSPSSATTPICAWPSSPARARSSSAPAGT
jgi:hypothetical protein